MKELSIKVVINGYVVSFDNGNGIFQSTFPTLPQAVAVVKEMEFIGYRFATVEDFARISEHIKDIKYEEYPQISHQ